MANNTKANDELLNIFNSLQLHCKDFKLIKNRLISSYCGMKNRCFYKKGKSYKNYGERGITICREWLDNPLSFYKWSLQNGYDYIPDDKGRNKLSLDRINVNGNYEPSNCRWVTYKQQRLNSTTNRIIEIDGNKKTITEWCEYYNIPYYIVNNRVNKYNWDVDRALKTPIMNKTLYDCYGELLTVPQIHSKYGIPKYAIYRKFKKMG